MAPSGVGTGGGRGWWLVAVAAAFTACQLLFVGPHLGLGWDETVYVSQVGSHAPPAFFSAPRARGITYLAFPVAALTTSTAALRCWFAVLSGAALLGALRVWLRFLPAPHLALAGVLFCGLWITQFYGPQAMPNLWVALASLACAGFFLRAVTAAHGRREGRSRTRALLGTALCLAAVVQLRPPDGFWLVLPLAVATASVRSWRQRAAIAALALGLVLGGAQWVVESFQHYGGVLARLHTSDTVEGGLTWHLAFGDQLRSLDGRTLCRPCAVPWSNRAVSLWWFALPVLAAGGVDAARRSRRLGPVLLATLCAVSMAVPYLLLIGYAAPRFLLPSYALLALPTAECLARLARGPGGAGARSLATAAVGVVLAAHLVVQHLVLVSTVTRNDAAHRDYASVAAGLHRLGVTPPCLVTGEDAIPIAYYAGCASAATSGNNAGTTPAGIRARAARVPTAVLIVPGQKPPGYARRWSVHRLPPPRELVPRTVYVAPLPGSRAAGLR